jgi:hypothetical protein
MSFTTASHTAPRRATDPSLYCCSVEAEKDVAVRTSILRASSVSPSGAGPSLLCLPAVHSPPAVARSSMAVGSPLSPVSGGSPLRPSMAMTDGGPQPRSSSAFGSFVGFRSSAISESLPDMSAAAAVAAAAAYTDKVS